MGVQRTTGGSGSRIIGLKELLIKVTEGMMQMVATPNGYKIANRDLQEKWTKEELTSLAT